MVKDTAQLRVSSAGMVRVLQNVFGLEAGSETRLVARVKQFQKDGIPLTERRGRGFNLSYGPREAARLSLGIALLESGMPTYAAGEALNRGSTDVEKALDLAAQGTDRVMIAVPGSELRIYRSPGAMLTEGSRLYQDLAKLPCAHSEKNGFRSYATVLVDVSSMMHDLALAFANEAGVDRKSVVLGFEDKG